MIDAENAAQLWLDRHDPTEWRQLLTDFVETPKLPDDVLGWLRGSSPELRMQLDELQQKHGLSASETLAQFEQAFVANVSKADGGRI